MGYLFKVQHTVHLYVQPGLSSVTFISHDVVKVCAIYRAVLFFALISAVLLSLHWVTKCPADSVDTHPTLQCYLLCAGLPSVLQSWCIPTQLPSYSQGSADCVFTIRLWNQLSVLGIWSCGPAVSVTLSSSLPVPQMKLCSCYCISTFGRNWWHLLILAVFPSFSTLDRVCPQNKILSCFVTHTIILLSVTSSWPVALSLKFWKTHIAIDVMCL